MVDFQPCTRVVGLEALGVVRLADGSMMKAELHWYEAHGIGRKLLKIKRFLDPT
jgi:hypothetical protein